MERVAEFQESVSRCGRAAQNHILTLLLLLQKRVFMAVAMMAQFIGESCRLSRDTHAKSRVCMRWCAHMCVICAALAWHPHHDSVFASGSFDGTIYFWIAG